MEEVDLNFEADTEWTSLKDLSAIAFASQLWQSPDMNEKLEEILDRVYPLWRDCESTIEKEKEMHFHQLSLEISKMVSLKLNNLNGWVLPEIFKIQIEEKALELLEERFNWIMYLIHDLKLDYKLTQEIYWTSRGKIDQDKIFRKFWMNHFRDTPIPWKGVDGNLKLIQYLACFFAQEEFIVINQADFVAEIKSYRSLQVEHDFDIVLTIMKIVVAYYRYRNFLLSDPVKITSEIVTKPTTEILEICQSLCLHKAFVSFWKRLNAIEQFDYLEKQSTNEFAFKRKNMYGADYSFSIILFLMKQMNYSQKLQFVLQNFTNLISTFSKKPAFQRFCIPLLEHFLPSVRRWRIDSLMTNLALDFEWSTQPRRHLLLQMLKRLLPHSVIQRSVPSAGTLKVDACAISVQIFFKIFNIPALKLIINEESLRYRKNHLIRVGETKYKALIEDDNFELLNQFIDEVLTTEEEKNKFKQDYNFLPVWVEKEQFDKADRVLVWAYGPNYHEHKIQLKYLYCRSIPKNYDSVQKLLKWFFGVQEEPIINGCADKLELLKEFCLELIYNVWFFVRNSCVTSREFIESSTKSCTEISIKVLLFVFGSQEEIQNFINNDLGKVENCVKFLSENAIISGFNFRGLEPRFPLMDEFFNFCSLSTSSIDNIKEQLDEKKIGRYKREWNLLSVAETYNLRTRPSTEIIFIDD